MCSTRSIPGEKYSSLAMTNLFMNWPCHDIDFTNISWRCVVLMAVNFNLSAIETFLKIVFRIFIVLGVAVHIQPDSVYGTVYHSLVAKW
jgi:hypothetical protein